MIKIAIIGDVHRHFNQADVHYFNQSEYDLLLFVGDLSNYRAREGVAVARVMAGLQKAAVFIPGNHDTINAVQLIAEVKNWPRIGQLAAIGQNRRVAALRQAMGAVHFGGFSCHPFCFGAERIDLIVGRPLSMGGPRLNFRPFLRQQFGIDSAAAAAAKLCQVVDSATASRLLFLAHSGPAGLGSRRDDIWGCDFLPEAGDFGDEDLRQAVAHAKSIGKQVPAVIGGHMHHRLKGGGQRRRFCMQDGTHYINAAYVPRIKAVAKKTAVHHHVQLCLEGDNVTVAEQFVPLPV